MEGLFKTLGAMAFISILVGGLSSKAIVIAMDFNWLGQVTKGGFGALLGFNNSQIKEEVCTGEICITQPTVQQPPAIGLQPAPAPSSQVQSPLPAPIERQ
ncbi:MAG: hypothetical protein HC781_23140 [Leptolyngbyaceae cyanobacterium CSU_1_4]|nr:hypothetical protein [Leptolyngbyaceae cyanobacterium CSU_1_4]